MVTYQNELTFDSPKVVEWIKKKSHKRLKNPELQRNNNWVTALFKRDFESKRERKLVVRPVNALIGDGVFADEDIARLSYIGEYTGHVRRRRRRKDRYNSYIFGYVVGPFDTPYVIDAEKSGNIIRMINHSYEPNLTSRWMIVDGICHVILFANKRIPKGTQLTYDYGPYYWKNRMCPVEL